jgi:hypothetical protein
MVDPVELPPTRLEVAMCCYPALLDYTFLKTIPLLLALI